MFRSGSLAESYVATGGFMRSDPALAVSDTIVVMAPALTTRGGVGARLRDLFPSRHGFVVMVSCGRPLSRGHVRLASADPTAHPRIFPNYFAEPEDLRSLTRSVGRVREMMRGEAIRGMIAAELSRRQVTAWRNAVFVTFALSGLAIASWLSRVPAVRDELGVTTTTLGLVLFGIAAGSMTGLLLSSHVIARFGTARTVLCSLSIGTLGLPLAALGSALGQPLVTFA